jgi:ABC-type uncharacterized transport system permease subunit
MPIIVQRNGETTVITGWRAWLIGLAAFIVGLLVLGFVTFVVAGVAITVGAVLAIALPVAIGVWLIASLFSRRPL